MKPLKRSVALVIERPDGMLLVRRPDDDESLPGLWGLPAVSLVADEAEEDAVRRAGWEKLGVEVIPLGPIGEAEGERPDYWLHIRDWLAEIHSGEPAVPQAAGGTQYAGLRWGDSAELADAARAGSLCCRVLMRSRDLGWDT
ncbi:MAG: NUDIX hydrolase [Thermoleophilaceae bacterium]|nr:NUDIX hydrolase [Thermoleophilaceae bacterium]